MLWGKKAPLAPMRYGEGLTTEDTEDTEKEGEDKPQITQMNADLKKRGLKQTTSGLCSWWRHPCPVGRSWGPMISGSNCLFFQGF